MNYIQFKKDDKLLYVFKHDFTFEEDCFTKADENLTENYYEIQDKHWLIYWNNNGEELVLNKWKRKYKDKYYTDTDSSDDIELTYPENDEEDVEFIHADTTSHVDEKSKCATNFSEGWNNLWEEHSQEIYEEYYHYFTAAFNNYYYCFKNCIKPEFNDNPEDYIITYLTEELKELDFYGLPTSFGKKSNSSNYKKPKMSCLNSEADDQTDDSMEYTTPSKVARIAEPDEKPPESLDLKRIKNADKIPSFLLTKNMIKYWRRRFSLFSLFDSGIQLDEESWFSVTPEKIAIHIANRLACDTIIDAFCGCGGNTIQFAKTCKKVIAIDIDENKINMAKCNADIYGVADKIEFIVGDFIELCDSGKLKADIIFLSPPWGGPKYKKKQRYDIDRYLLPIGGTQLMEKCQVINDNIAFYLPRNTDLQKVVKLAGIGNKCEVEHNFLDTRLVAITAFFGTNLIKN